MGRLIDLTGKRFGKLVVLCRVENDKLGHTRWHCVCDCGKETDVWAHSLTTGHTKSCGCYMKEWERKNPSGEKSPLWKGGKRIARDGYVRIRLRNHPCSDKTGWIAEHRVVMEDYLGRYLQPCEAVHHKNGNRHDNRLENLELWNRKHPTGIRAKDIEEGVVEIKILRRQNPNIISSL